MQRASRRPRRGAIKFCVARRRAYFIPLDFPPAPNNPKVSYCISDAQAPFVAQPLCSPILPTSPVSIPLRTNSHKQTGNLGQLMQQRGQEAQGLGSGLRTEARPEVVVDGGGGWEAGDVEEVRKDHNVTQV